jgi:hypothetical protein
VKTQFIEHAFEISSFLFFIVPMTVICVLYILIGLKLRQSKLLYGKKMKTSDSERYIKGQTRVIRMLSKIVDFIDQNHFPNSKFPFSRGCRDFFSLLGAVPRATHYGCLRKNHEEVIQKRRPFYARLHRSHLHFGNFLLPVNVHQSFFVQHHESQIQKCFEGKKTFLTDTISIRFT